MAATTWRRLNAKRDHRWARPLMSGYVEGELPARQERRMAAHEQLCPECTRMIATLRALMLLLPSLRLPPHIALGIAERTTEHVRAQVEEWS